MNTFMGTFGDDGNAMVFANGYSYTNTVLNIDTQGNTIDVNISSANASDNTFVGGQIATATYGIYASAGSSNKFINVNNAISGAGTSFLPSSTGGWLETPNINMVHTLGVPGSGAAYTNTTGQMVMAALPGGYSERREAQLRHAVRHDERDRDATAPAGRQRPDPLLR